MPQRHNRLYLFLLLAGATLSAFWRLGSLPLFDVDEPVYAEVGKEMALGGPSAWLTPHYNGGVWFDKPPLFYWLTAASMRLFGNGEFAARFPSALCSVLLVGLTYALASRAFPHTRRAGLWAGFVLATCGQHLMLARAAVTDMTFTTCLTASLLGIFLWTSAGKVKWLLFAGAMAGLAALTKGPAAFVLLGGQIFSFQLLTRKSDFLRRPAFWLSASLCLLIALPWYVAMIHLHGRAFTQGFLEANNITRYLHAEHPSTQSVFFFIPVLLAFFLPWTLVLPVALRSLRDAGFRQRLLRHPGTAFLIVWCAIVFLFFSLSQSKLVTYIFPLYPAAAVLLGGWIARHVGTKSRRDQWKWLAPGAVMWIALICILDAPAWRTRDGEVSQRRVALAAAAAAPKDAALYALDLKRPSLVYYSGRRVVFLESSRNALPLRKASPGRYYFLRFDTLRRLQPRYFTKFRVIFQYAGTVLIRTGV